MQECFHIAAENYQFCDPFQIRSTADLQIRLAKAQARIMVLEEMLRDTEIKMRYLVASGGTIPLLK